VHNLSFYTRKMSVIVLGSINIDIVAKVSRSPLAGETVHGSDFFTAFGGKGANQAVTVARLGVETYMVGRVGGDRFGQELLTSLQDASVRTEHVIVDQQAPSGTAVIIVDRHGENQIVIVAGANGNVGKTDVESMSNLLPQAKALLMQLEIPLNAVELAASIARDHHIPIILDPAPARQDIPAQLYAAIDIITPNETEASQLLGISVHSPETAHRAAIAFRKKGVGTAIVKLGSQGVVCATANETFLVPAFRVKAIDTVAAGDAFNGALAAAIVLGLSIKQAVVWGAAAGALCSTKSGAQPAIPNLEQLKIFLAQHREIIHDGLGDL
jgi:ribokinase